MRKRNDIAWDMIKPAYKRGMTDEHISRLASAFMTHPFQICEGDIFDALGSYLDSQGLDSNLLVPFLRDLAELTPVGLNTSPNACCGRWELFYRLVRPSSSQPSKGDIRDGSITIELKGSQVRLSDPSTTGVEYRKRNHSIYSDSPFSGNKTTAKDLKDHPVFEIEKIQHRLHYQSQWEKAPDEARKCMKRYLQEYEFDSGLGDAELDSLVAKIIGTSGEYDLDTLQRRQLECFFHRYKSEQSFDILILFGDGSDVKFIKDARDLNKLRIQTDYFRIAQKANIGWYVE
jgi:hypothetical protein